MIILKDGNISSPKMKKAAIALGVFDGVHKGHRKLIEVLQQTASSRKCTSIVYTFCNHPEEIIFGVAPKYIDTFEEKAAKIGSLGVEYLWAVTFTKEMASIKPEAFVTGIIQQLDIDTIIAGYDFSFGDKGEGRAKDLERLGAKYGFNVITVPALMDNGLPISSSRIRALIADGDIEEANKMICSPYLIQGTICQGKKIGTLLGFPTANLKYDIEKVIPANGVYVTRINIKGIWLPSITNVGYNPTIDSDDTIKIETHIMNFNDDIYECRANLQFQKMLRTEIKFRDRESLMQQIQMDIVKAKEYFGE